VGPSGRKVEGLVGEEVKGVLRLRVLDKKVGVGGEGKTRRVRLRLDRGMAASPVPVVVEEAARSASATELSRSVQGTRRASGDAAQPESTAMVELELYAGLFT
jgi:hypothetical protein